MKRRALWMMMGPFWGGFALGCGGADSGLETDAQPAGYSAAWAEFVSAADVEAALPTLKRARVEPLLAWPAASVADPARIGLVARAEQAAVRVRPWLLLEESDGYWPGSTNASSFAKAARELMDAWEAAALRPTEFVVDMELRKDRATLLEEKLRSEPPDLAGVLTLLGDSIDPAEHALATTTYAELVDEAHARGWSVHLTTLPQVLDDYADGDDSLRQAFGIPVEGIAWDAITFQAYRTLFGALLGSEQILTSYFVYRYGRDARERFGERAGLDLGLVGQGVTASPVYESPRQLAEDVEAAHAAGVPRELINVYNLDGILAREPSTDWLLALPATPVTPAPDEASAALAKQVALLDGAL